MLELQNFVFPQCRMLHQTFFSYFFDFLHHERVVGRSVYQFFAVAVQVGSDFTAANSLDDLLLFVNVIIQLGYQLQSLFFNFFVLRPSNHLHFIVFEGGVKSSRCVVEYFKLYPLELAVHVVDLH